MSAETLVRNVRHILSRTPPPTLDYFLHALLNVFSDMGTAPTATVLYTGSDVVVYVKYLDRCRAVHVQNVRIAGNRVVPTDTPQISIWAC